MTQTVEAVFDADTLELALARIMAAIVDAAAVLPGVADLPSRQLATTAGATWDCPMVYVSALTLQLGLPEPVGVDQRLVGATTYPPQSGLAVWTVTVEAGVVRKLSAMPVTAGPTQRPPTTDAYAADLAVVSSDTAVLVNASATLGARDWQPIGTETASFLESQGGFHGVAGTFTVEVFPGPPITPLP